MLRSFCQKKIYTVEITAFWVNLLEKVTKLIIFADQAQWANLVFKDIGLRYIKAQKWLTIATQKKFIFDLFHSFAWTHKGICMDVQWNLHGGRMELAWTQRRNWHGHTTE